MEIKFHVISNLSIYLHILKIIAKCIITDAARLHPSASHVDKISAEYNQTVTFSLHVIANPLPTFKWSRISDNKDSPLLIKSKVTSYGFVSNLTIPRVTKLHMLSYTCAVENDVGTKMFLFKLLLATCEYLYFYS